MTNTTLQTNSKSQVTNRKKVFGVLTLFGICILFVICNLGFGASASAAVDEVLLSQNVHTGLYVGNARVAPLMQEAHTVLAGVQSTLVFPFVGSATSTFISFPTTALSPFVLVYGVYDQGSLLSLFPPPSGFVVVGDVYSLEAFEKGAPKHTFNSAYDFSIALTPAKLSNVIPSTITLFTLDEESGVWQEVVGAEYDENTRTLTTSIDHMSLFAAFGQAEQSVTQTPPSSGSSGGKIFTSTDSSAQTETDSESALRAFIDALGRIADGLLGVSQDTELVREGSANVSEEVARPQAAPLELLDIRLDADKPVFASGDKPSVTLSFQSFGKEPALVSVTLGLFDASDRQLEAHHDRVIVETSALYRKEFATPLSAGTYRAVATTRYGEGIEDVFVTQFEVTARSATALVPWLLYVGLAFLLFVVCMFVARRFRIWPFFIALLIFPFSVFNSAHAAVPYELNYVAELNDSTGFPVANGDYNVRFKLYTAATGGSPIFTETWCYGASCNGSGTDNRVPLADGVFETPIGGLASLTSIDFNQTLYLGIEIGGASTTAAWDGEMTPRKKLSAVPNALNSDKLAGQAASYYLDSKWATSSANIYYTEGNVGIGTTSPGNLLDVNGKVGMSTLASYARTTGSNTIKVEGSGDIEQWINFRAGGSPVGASGALFSRYGTSHFFVNHATGSTAGLHISYSTESTDSPALANATTLLTLASSGNLGVGSTNPQNKLTIANKNVNGVALDFRSDDTTVANTDFSVARLFADFDSTSYADSKLQLQTATAENTWLTGLTVRNGKVGIGTTNPGSALTVVGTSTIRALEIENIGGSGNPTFTSNSGSGRRLRLDIDSFAVGDEAAFSTNYDAVFSSQRARNALADTGNGFNYLGVFQNLTDTTGQGAGIALSVTTASDNLTGAIIAERTGSNGKGSLHFYTKQSTTGGADPARVMTLSDAGNVGIGTAAPTFKLELSGTAATSDRKIGINGTQVLYLPDQSSTVFSQSLFFGNGGASLSHSTGAEGHHNTGVGIQALLGVTSGQKNTALGTDALKTITSGRDNVGIGYQALETNTTGMNNVSIGNYSQEVSTGSNNTSVGFQSMQNLTTGDMNAAFGMYAMRNNATGTANTALGRAAMFTGKGSDNTMVGKSAGFYLDWGNDNVIIGSGAAATSTNLTSGSRNIIIGKDALVPNATTNDFLNLGNTLYGNLSTKKIGIGTSTIGETLTVAGGAQVSDLTSCTGIQTNASGVMSCASDEDLKDVQGAFERGLDAIVGITPVAYSWKEDSYLHDGGVLYSGFLAQDVAEHIPEAVATGTKGYLQLSHLTLTATLVNAVREIATFADSFRTALVDWLASAGNGITRIFAREYCAVAEDGETHCLTGEDIKRLRVGAAATVDNTSAVNTENVADFSPVENLAEATRTMEAVDVVLSPDATTTSQNAEEVQEEAVIEELTLEDQSEATVTEPAPAEESTENTE